MQAKLLKDGPEKTWALIFQSGDEAVSGLKQFAKENHLAGSHFTGIGALSELAVGYFDWQTKHYRRIPIREQVEVLSLIGDITYNAKGEPEIHAHVVVGRSDGTTRGGHLMDGHVRPTLEIILTESPGHLRRRHDPESGLALIDPMLNAELPALI